MRLRSYRNEYLGAATIAGTRHTGGSQDAFFPGDLETLDPDKLGLDMVDLWRMGRLYVFADGVTRCANGRRASQVAAATVAKFYYHCEAPVKWPNNDERAVHLLAALRSAHNTLRTDDSELYCWRTNESAHFGREFRGGLADLVNGYCPYCGQGVAGLQATMLAAVVVGDTVLLAGIGDSLALRFNPRTGQLHNLWEPERAFLGMSGNVQFRSARYQLAAGEYLLLGGDGLRDLLQWLYGKSPSTWLACLQQFADELRTATVIDFPQRVSDWLSKQHAARQQAPANAGLNDDLTVLMLRMPNETERLAWQEERMPRLQVAADRWQERLLYLPDSASQERYAERWLAETWCDCARIVEATAETRALHQWAALNSWVAEHKETVQAALTLRTGHLLSRVPDWNRLHNEVAARFPDLRERSHAALLQLQRYVVDAQAQQHTERITDTEPIRDDTNTPATAANPSKTRQTYVRPQPANAQAPIGINAIEQRPFTEPIRDTNTPATAVNPSKTRSAYVRPQPQSADCLPIGHEPKTKAQEKPQRRPGGMGIPAAGHPFGGNTKPNPVPPAPEPEPEPEPFYEYLLVIVISIVVATILYLILMWGR